jgi:hypothetical protein
MENKSIVTPYIESHPAHKHLKKLIALEDRIAKYKRTHEVKESVQAFYVTVNDLQFITDLRRKCSTGPNHKIGPGYMKTMNHMWKQYK